MMHEVWFTLMNRKILNRNVFHLGWFRNIGDGCHKKYTQQCILWANSIAHMTHTCATTQAKVAAMPKVEKVEVRTHLSGVLCSWTFLQLIPTGITIYIQSPSLIVIITLCALRCIGILTRRLLNGSLLFHSAVWFTVSCASFTGTIGNIQPMPYICSDSNIISWLAVQN